MTDTLEEIALLSQSLPVRVVSLLLADRLMRRSIRVLSVMTSTGERRLEALLTAST